MISNLNNWRRKEVKTVSKRFSEGSSKGGFGGWLG